MSREIGDEIGKSPRQRRIDAKVGEAFVKLDLGEELTEHEWRVVQYALGGSCSVCDRRG